MIWLRLFLGFILALGAALATSAQTTNSFPLVQTATAVDSVDVSLVSATYPVGFALLTHPPYQFVAFYNDHRRLVVAQRKLDSTQWRFNKLPDLTKWDSHNYIALAADDDGYLHLSADMHNVPLKYFRTKKPWDASTFKRLNKMTGTNELNCTYPKFLHGPNHEFLFTYRSGHSGGGNQVYDLYDPPTKTWHPFLDTPLTDGQGTNNAYIDGPVLGPDGWYHMAWVWRATGDAETCHDLSYARSRDLEHWETSTGRPLTLPIRLDNCEIVDPVPERGGMSNANIRIGFDDQGRITISYHKNDTNDYTQPMIARLENGHWVMHQVADWPRHWDFKGYGTLPPGIRIGRVNLETNGMLTEYFEHYKFGTGTWELDPQTLHAIGQVQKEVVPPDLDKPQGDFPGLDVHWESDSSKDAVTNLEYLLRWETLDANRDHPREGKLPAPDMLKVVAVRIMPTTAKR